MKPVPRPELEYLRRHIREAIADERIVCLACGVQMRNLGRHLAFTHRVTVEEYRATWGYNRLTPLVCGEVLAQFRAHAKRRGLGTTNTREMALAALHARQQREPIPLRREALERLRERPQHGQGVGPPRKISDAELLTLTAQGLSFDQIARLRGLARVNVWRRLARLKAQGHPIASRRPRPAGKADGER
jgi:hypothetical protein